MMLQGSSKTLKPTHDFQPSDTEIACLEQVLKGGNVQLNITQTGRYVGQTGRVTEKCRLDEYGSRNLDKRHIAQEGYILRTAYTQLFNKYHK